MKKILFVATTAKGHLNVFHIPYIKRFKDNGFIIHSITNGDAKVPFVHKEYNVKIERNPFCLNNLKALIQICGIFKNEDYDAIICHTPMGAALTRIAGKITNAKRVIYMAHGFHFFKGASIKNKIIYGSMERVLARWTDVIITINTEDFESAKKFNMKKNGMVYYVNGIGVNVDKITNIIIDRELKMKELNIPKDKKIILIVGEFIKRKNYETAIKAFSKINNKDYILLICGSGKLEDNLKNIVKSLGIESKVIFAGFRNDINEIIKVSDIFLFTSFQEGLPVAIMEAMAGELPVVCSNVRGNSDLIKNNEGGFVINDCKDAEAFARAIEKLDNAQLRKKMGSINRENIKKYDLKNVIDVIYDIYTKDIS